MQNRMKTHPLTGEQVALLLKRAETGTLATLNPDGTPYCTPIHFVHCDGAIYFHGLPKGQKLNNIARDPRVGFTVFEMAGLLLDPDEKPCDTNTEYESVILTGSAEPVKDAEKKRAILKQIVLKYTPKLAERELPENMVNGTAVIRIAVTEITGKYYS